MIIGALLLFLFILSILIFIHELGHFTTARKFGVDVEEFGMGIPPRAWGKKVGKTLYSINWLPLGGFVRIKGEDYENYDPNDPGNFINKKPWQKSVILLAGIFMNLLLAVTIFYFTLGINDWRSQPLLLLNDFQFPLAGSELVPNVITFIATGSPADEAGIQFADQVVSLSYDGETVETTTLDDIRSFVSDKDGKEITVNTVNINTDEVGEYFLTPEYSEEIDQPAIGISLESGVILTYNEPVEMLLAGPMHSVNVMVYSFSILGSMIKTSVETGDFEAVSQGVSGPVGIFGAVKAVLESGSSKVFIAILDLTALLSLSLAIMNLLPIPALDGGRFVFVLYEWITGKRPSAKFEAITHQVGFVILIGLLILITFKDVFQLINY